MGKIEIDHTGAGSGITLSSDGTDLLLNGTAIGGGGGAALELYAENPSSPTAPSATGTNAVAIGSGTVASQNGNIALGQQANASGSSRAVALGYLATASANYSMSAGPFSDATGGGSTALGFQSQAISGEGATALTKSYASGTDSFAAAIANNTSSYGATGANSVAIGQTAKATAQQSSAVGRAATATGTYSAAMGYTATASGLAGTAVGYNTVASGNSATALGREARATANAALAIGAGIFGAQINASGVGSTAIGMNSSSVGAQAITGAGAMALGGSYASGTDSFAAAIANNTSSYGATGANSVVMGREARSTGSTGLALGAFSAALGTNIAIGRTASASGTNSLALGSNVEATTSFAVALGRYAISNIVGKLAFATSRFLTSSGTAQQGQFVLLSDTEDATPEALTTGNTAATTNNQIILPNNSAYAFHGTIVARQQASAGTACAAWKIEGLIRREGSAGTTVLVNSATTVLDNTPAWGMALSADTTNGGLKIEVTGAAATNIRWVATIHTSEVTY